MNVSVTYRNFKPTGITEPGDNTIIIARRKFPSHEIITNNESSLNLDWCDPNNTDKPSEATNIYRTTMVVSHQPNQASTSYALLQHHGRPETQHTYFELVYDTNEWVVGKTTALLQEHEDGTRNGVHVSVGKVECKPASGEIFENFILQIDIW